MTNDEIKAAISRLPLSAEEAEIEDVRTMLRICEAFASRISLRELHDLARNDLIDATAQRDELADAADEAEKEERAKPIDEEWLRSLGPVVCGFCKREKENVD